MHRIPQQRTAWLWAIASSRCADLNHDLPKCKQLFLDKALASIPLNHCNDPTYKFLSPLLISSLLVAKRSRSNPVRGSGERSVSSSIGLARSLNPVPCILADWDYKPQTRVSLVEIGFPLFSFG